MVPWSGRAAGSEWDEEWTPFGTVETGRIRPEPLVARSLAGRDASLDYRHSGELYVFSGSASAEVRRDLCRRLDGALTGAVVTIRMFDVAAGEPVDERAREIASCSGPVLTGLGACFLGSEERNYLQDWDVEVAQGSLIPDPIVEKVESGHYTNVKVLTGPGDRPVEVLLDVQLLELVRIDPVDMPIKILWGRKVTTGELTGGKDPGTVSGVEVGPDVTIERAIYRYERPLVKEFRISSALPLDAEGSCELRRSATGFLGPGREVAVTVTAK
jgi:hypothetical protein